MAFSDTKPIHAEGVFVLLAEKEDDNNEALRSALRLYLLSLPLEDTQVPLADGRVVSKRERAVVVKNGEVASWGDQELVSLKPEDYGVITGAIDANDASPIQASMREAMEECELTLDPTRLIQVERGGNIEVDQHRNGTEYTFVVNGSLYLMTPEEKEALAQNMRRTGRNIVELHWKGNERDVALFSENTPNINLRPVAHAVLQLLTGLEGPITFK